MVELRWLVRPHKVSISGDIQHTALVERVLQYRQCCDRSSRAESNLSWTDWQDVPVVQEELP